MQEPRKASVVCNATLNRGERPHHVGTSTSSLPVRGKLQLKLNHLPFPSVSSKQQNGLEVTSGLSSAEMPISKISALSKPSRRLHTFCLFLALGSFVWGYNFGVLASVLVHPGFKATLGTDLPKNGLITAVYYVGTWLSYIFFAHPAADRLGRRYAALVGMAVMCLGQGLQASATGAGALEMMLAGRVVAGLGTGIVSTSVPLYQRYNCLGLLL